MWRNCLYQWLKEKLEIAHGENTPLRSMEGMRGIAVFLVFWVHYSSLIEPWLSGNTSKIADFIHTLGHLGVDLFFVLSGYLIYGSIMNKHSFHVGNYSKRRVQRIYPTFLVVFAIYLVLSLLYPNESKLPAGIWPQILYIGQNLLLLPGIFDIEPIITVAWSLSYEMFYYLLIPIVIFILRLKSWRPNQRILLWIMVSIAGFYCCYLWQGPTRLLMFIAGILLFELNNTKLWTIHNGGTKILVVSIAAFAIARSYGIDYSLCMSVIFISFIALGLCAFNGESRVSRWLSYAPLRWFGNMSYSYYLIHGLSLKFCFLIFGKLVDSSTQNELLYYWLWLPFFLITLVTSFCLFIAIEKPFSLNLKHRTQANN
jgi:peptidoglycan/LPS O-acetylase OafA/YrhL